MFSPDQSSILRAWLAYIHKISNKSGQSQCLENSSFLYANEMSKQLSLPSNWFSHSAQVLATGSRQNIPIPHLHHTSVRFLRNIIFLGYLNPFTSAKGLLPWVSHRNQVWILQTTLLFELFYLINVQNHGFHLTCTMSLKAVRAGEAQIYVQLKLIAKQSFANKEWTKLLHSLLSTPVKMKLISGKLCSHSFLKRQKSDIAKYFRI